MDTQADKSADAGNAALAARDHKAKILFYDTAYEILTKGVAMQSDIETYSKAIKDSIREIERATSLNNYPYGMREKELICSSVKTMCNSFSKLANELSETVCARISLRKYAIMCGEANSKGIEHVHSYEIVKMLRKGLDGRVFEVSPEGIVKPKDGASDPYTPEQLRAELDAIKALEAELDKKNPLYADMLSMDAAAKHEFSLQAIINSGKVSKSWDDELIEIAYKVVKDFGKKGYLDPYSTLSMLSDIDALKSIYALSFSMAPKDSYDELGSDDVKSIIRAPSVKIVPNVKLERR
jgi:hypothetical protein